MNRSTRTCRPALINNQVEQVVGVLEAALGLAAAAPARTPRRSCTAGVRSKSSTGLRFVRSRRGPTRSRSRQNDAARRSLATRRRQLRYQRFRLQPLPSPSSDVPRQRPGAAHPLRTARSTAIGSPDRRRPKPAGAVEGLSHLSRQIISFFVRASAAVSHGRAARHEWFGVNAWRSCQLSPNDEAAAPSACRRPLL